MFTKSQLKELFIKYNFTPLKRLGENYLIDGNVKDKIIGEAGIRRIDTVLEIGPGFGALTIDLASSGARIFAVEKDKKAFSILKELFKDSFPNIKLLNGDILEFDIRDIAKRDKIKVVGNLPYYITTPIIEYLIGNRKFIESMLIAVQREVANRFLAVPGSKDYGSISCFLQYFTKPSYLFTIKRASFYPKPDVDSSLLRFAILDNPSVEVEDEEIFFKIIRGSFNQRRKTIMNSLSRKEVLNLTKNELADILCKAGINPASRPEDLGLGEFANLTNVMACGNLYLNKDLRK